MRRINMERETDNKKTFNRTTSPFHILVAEDNIINRKFILRILKKMGLHADVVENGIEALKALEKKYYHLILMDIQMPKMDGMEATRRIIEKYKTGERPRIIAVTACADRGDRERFLGIGMDDYISKPIDIKQFKERITYWTPQAGNI